MSIYEKLGQVISEKINVEKSGYNDAQKYKYVEIAEIKKTIQELLAKHGLVYFGTCEGIERVSLGLNKDGNAKPEMTRVKMKYTLAETKTNEKIESVFYGEGMDAGDKGVYKAYTGAEKYFLIQTFAISTGDDPENESCNTGHTSTVTTKPEAPKQENKNGYVPPVKKEWKDLTPAEQFAWFVKKAEKEGIKIDLDAMSTLPVSDRISIIKKALNDKKKAEAVNEPF